MRRLDNPLASLLGHHGYDGLGTKTQEADMKYYCGMDLHSSNTVIVVINERDERLVERRISNELPLILAQLEPHRASITSIAVESTYNWYWLVDGLMDHGYDVKLVNTAAVQQYEGLKQIGDRHDAFWLAHLMRLDILPTGFIYPRPQRWQRDLLRKRLGLVRERTRHILSLQSLWTRHTSERLSVRSLRQRLPELSLGDTTLDMIIDCDRCGIVTLDETIKLLERRLHQHCVGQHEQKLLKTVNGIGEILGATILLESGPIERFHRVGNYASYCRLVASERWSNGKMKGTGNRKCGNKYLSWAYTEAAHFAIRFDDRARRFYDRKRAQRNGIVAVRAVAHKLARACYFILRDGVPYQSAKLFG